jgi:hypothetical protein
VPVGTPIWFSSYTLEKLRYIHGEIIFSHYLNMPAILLRGFVVRGRAPNVLELCWIQEIGGEKICSRGGWSAGSLSSSMASLPVSDRGYQRG